MNKISFKSLSTYRDALMGVAMIAVFFFHCGKGWAPNYITDVTSRGYMGVAVFIFLSAIGLSYSLEKNNNIIAFYKRRLLRIFPTYWLIMTCVYTFVAVLINSGIMPLGYYRYPHTAWEAIQSYTTIGFWIKGGFYDNWYIPAIIVLYLFFPFVYKMYSRWRWTAISIAIVPLLLALFPEKMFGEYAYFLSFVGIFLYGALAYYWVKSECSINGFVIMLIGWGALFYYCLRQIMHWGMIPMPILETSLLYATFPFMLLALVPIIQRQLINNALSFVGKISFEFYLIHEFILRLLMTVSNRVFYISPFLQKMCGFIISLCIAYIIHLVMTKLMSKNSKKEKGNRRNVK